MAIHSSILARRIPWTEEPGRLQSMGPQRSRIQLKYVTAWHSVPIRSPTNAYEFVKWIQGYKERLYILCFPSDPLCVCVLVTQSCPTLCDPMDCTASQAPLSMGFSGQEYWSGLPFPSPGDIPDSGIEPASPESPTWACGFFTLSHLGSPFQ